MADSAGATQIAWKRGAHATMRTVPARRWSGLDGMPITSGVMRG